MVDDLVFAEIKYLMLGLIIKKWTLVCIFHLLLYFDFNNISAEDTCSHTFVGQDRINISKAPFVSLEQSEPILNQNTVFKQFLKVNFLILVHLMIRLDKWDSDPVITKTGNRKTDYFTLVLMVNLHIVSYMDGLLQSKGVLIALVQVLTQVSVPYLPCAVQWSTVFFNYLYKALLGCLLKWKLFFSTNSDTEIVWHAWLYIGYLCII